MTRKLLIASVPAAVGFASVAAAMGLGSINSESTLNQPLKARIELLSVDPDDIGRISAQLAPPEAFDRAGLERPFFLSRLDFDVVREGDAVFVEVTTDGAVKEPFLDFLVELNWPSGRLLREYTLLLDPPTYTDDLAPMVAASGEGEAVSGDAGDDASDAAAETARAAPAAGPAAASTGEAAASPARYGPVQANETLYSIADQVRPDGVSINQTMLALLRTNPDAFIDGNINALRRGAILRMPERPELTRLSTVEATTEVREQMARWQEQRSAPGAADAGMEVAEAAGTTESTEPADATDGAATPPAEAMAEQADAGAAAQTAGAGGKAAGDEPAVEGADALGSALAGEAGGELRLVAPEESAGVDATTSLAEADLEATPRNLSRLQDQLALLEESNAGLEAENADLREQVSGLREELDELERMINLRLAQELPISGDAGGESAAEPDSGDGSAAGLDVPLAAGGEASGAGATAADATGGEAAAGGAAGEAAVAADAGAAPAGDDGAGAGEASGTGGTEVVTAQAEEASGSDAVAADADASAPAAESAAAEPEPATAEPPAPASFLDMMLADTRMLTYGGGGVALLLLLLLLVQRSRRGGATEDADEGLPTPQVAPVAAAGGAAAGGAAAAHAGEGHDEDSERDGIAAEAGDPIEEAELYLAYGRADQAQEVLDRALGEDPDNLVLRTRLLEILAERGDRAGFEAEAQVLHTQVTDQEDPHWQRIAELGRSLAPEHPLFAAEENATAAAVGDWAGAVMPAHRAAGADVATPFRGGADPEGPRADEGEDEDFGFELDLDDDPEHPEPAQGGAAAGDAVVGDAGEEGRPDRHAGAQDGASADADALGDLDFDLGDFASGERARETRAAEDTSEARSWEDGDLEFSLDEPAPASGAEARGGAGEPPEFRLDDDLESALDGDDDERAPTAATGAGADEGDLDFGDFSFDEPSRGDDDDVDGGDIDGLDEVGTKLDLARAYMDMGDSEGARSLLDEVTEEGNEAQRREAEELLARTG